MSSIDQHYQNTDVILSPKDSVEFILRAYRSKHPVMMWGPPGCGKTEIAKQSAKRINKFYDPTGKTLKIKHVVVIQAPVWEPMDVKGVPVPKSINIEVYDVASGKIVMQEKDITAFAVPLAFPADATLFIIDELASAPRATQAAFQRFVLERSLDNGYVCHPDSFFLCLANRIADNAGAGALITSLDNRFLHCSLKTNAQDWIDWVLDEYSQDVVGEPHKLEAAAMVSSYIKHKPENLYQFDASNSYKDIHGYATPRTWQYVVDIIADTLLNRLEIDDFITESLIRGALGNEVGTAAAGFFKSSKELPSVMAILDGKGKVSIPLSEPGKALLILGSIGCHCSEKYFNRIYDVADFCKTNGKSDYATFLMKIAFKTNRFIAFDKATGAASARWEAYAASGGACDLVL